MNNKQGDLFSISPTILPAASDHHLRHIQVKLEAQMAAGAGCPCCGQFVRIYKRKLNSIMAAFLIWLVRRDRASGESWQDIKAAPDNIRSFGGDYAKLAHWGLVANKPNNDPSRRSSGLWRPTPKGVDFALAHRPVPSHVHLYNNEVIGFSERQVSIVEALGARFDYQELMSS